MITESNEIIIIIISPIINSSCSSISVGVVVVVVVVTNMFVFVCVCVCAVMCYYSLGAQYLPQGPPQAANGHGETAFPLGTTPQG